jgi:hypothetical protein
VPDLRKGQAQALDQFNVAQRLGDKPRITVGLAHDRALLGFDLAAEKPGQSAKHQHADEKHRHQQPVLREGIPGQEADADHGRERGIDEGIDETFAVGPHFLQQRQGLAAAQVFEFLELQAQQMA